MPWMFGLVFPTSSLFPLDSFSLMPIARRPSINMILSTRDVRWLFQSSLFFSPFLAFLKFFHLWWHKWLSACLRPLAFTPRHQILEIRLSDHGLCSCMLAFLVLSQRNSSSVGQACVAWNGMARSLPLSWRLSCLVSSMPIFISSFSRVSLV